MQQDTMTVLSPECKEELGRWDAMAVELDDRPGFAKILTQEGDEMFWVTASIYATDLRAMLRYGQRQRDVGQQEGRKNMQAQIRSLINAAPLEL